VDVYGVYSGSHRIPLSDVPAIQLFYNCGTLHTRELLAVAFYYAEDDPKWMEHSSHPCKVVPLDYISP
jgi:hypothetical protein